MASTPRQLCQFVASTVETTVYGPVPAATRVIVTNIIVANTSASPVACSLSVVPPGGTAGNANRIVPGTTIGGNQMVPIDMAQVLEPGMSLSALGGANASLTVTISGVVIA